MKDRLLSIGYALSQELMAAGELGRGQNVGLVGRAGTDSDGSDSVQHRGLLAVGGRTRRSAACRKRLLAVRHVQGVGSGDG